MKAFYSVESVTVNSDGSIRFDPAWGGFINEVPDTPPSTTSGASGPIPSGVTRVRFTSIGANILVSASQPSGSNIQPAKILVQDGQTVLLAVQSGDYLSIGQTDIV